jgi:hypothetical protein
VDPRFHIIELSHQQITLICKYAALEPKMWNRIKFHSGTHTLSDLDTTHPYNWVIQCILVVFILCLYPKQGRNV